MTKWAEIPGFSGLYEISDEGTVVRIATHGLSPKSIRRQIRPHRRNKYLAFKGTIPDGIDINHIDGDKDNNRLDNLELVTRSGNMVHCFQNLNPSLSTGGQAPQVQADARNRG